MSRFKIGAKYKHYKGTVYELINLGRDSETLKPVVIYKEVTDKPLFITWVRPSEMWFEEVSEGVKRFTLIEDK